VASATESTVTSEAMASLLTGVLLSSWTRGRALRAGDVTS
jgi:hypothetical protein